MPRSKPQKAASSPKIFQAPIVPLRSSRRLTLAGPSQLMSKEPALPFVFLGNDMLRKLEKRMPNAAKPKSETKSKTGNKAAAKGKERGSNSKKAKAVVASPKSKAKSVKASPNSKAKTVKSSPKSKAKTVKRSPKAKAKTVKASPKLMKSPSPHRSRRSAIVKSSPKPSSPKQQKSPTPKSSAKSPSHSRSLRPARVASPPTQKSANAARKRDRSLSPVNQKRPKVTAVSEKKKSPVKSVAGKRDLSASRASKKKPRTVAVSEKQKSPKETPRKPLSRKRKRDTSEERGIDKLSPPQKKQPVEAKSHSAAKKSPKKVSQLSPSPKKSPVLTKSRSAVKKTPKKASDVSFTAVKSAKVTENAVKSDVKGVSASQQNATPVKAKLENDVSMNWSLSSIRKRLLAGLTPYRMRENSDSPAVTNNRQLKSALFSGKKTENTEKRATKRQSVKFAVTGKAEKVKELKQRSSRKRFCYRMCQYLLLIGLPAAMTVGTVLVYNGLI